MKCFECGFTCATIYWHNYERKIQWFPQFHPNCPVTSVSKKCNMCGWTSHPVKIPEPI